MASSDAAGLVQFLVEAEIFRRKQLGDVSNLTVVHAEVLDYVVDHVDPVSVIALHVVFGKKLGGREAVEHCRGFVERGAQAVQQLLRGGAFFGGELGGRLRLSSSLLNVATIHWRTLPLKCSKRLPMEFEASLGRHQIWSVVSDATQVFMRGQCCSKRSFREESRKSAVSSELTGVMRRLVGLVRLLALVKSSGAWVRRPTLQPVWRPALPSGVCAH